MTERLAENNTRLTQSERRTHQSLRDRGFNHENALSDALDGLDVHDAERRPSDG